MLESGVTLILPRFPVNVKTFIWSSPNKSDTLVSLVYILQGDVLDDLKHPNPDKYPNQRVLAVKVEDYVYLIPYVETDDEFFLKTIIPSRKATKQYLGE